MDGWSSRAASTARSSKLINYLIWDKKKKSNQMYMSVYCNKFCKIWLFQTHCNKNLSTEVMCHSSLFSFFV